MRYKKPLGPEGTTHDLERLGSRNGGRLPQRIFSRASLFHSVTGPGEKVTPKKHGDPQLSTSQARAFAGMIAENLFQDYHLSEMELSQAADVLWPAVGGAVFQRIVRAAMKGRGVDAYGYGVSQRVHDAMWYHMASADWERLALRTGASLMFNGQMDTGKKIVEMTAEGNWKPPPAAKGTAMFYVQMSLYAVMFSVTIFGSWATGLWLLLAFVAPIVIIAGIGTYLNERPRWKAGRELREARHYEAALDRINRGAKPTDVFAFDGGLVGHPEGEAASYPFEVSSTPEPSANPGT